MQPIRQFGDQGGIAMHFKKTCMRFCLDRFAERLNSDAMRFWSVRMDLDSFGAIYSARRSERACGRCGQQRQRKAYFIRC